MHILIGKALKHFICQSNIMLIGQILLSLIFKENTISNSTMYTLSIPANKGANSYKISKVGNTGGEGEV